jgi:hypothetical protein
MISKSKRMMKIRGAKKRFVKRRFVKGRFMERRKKRKDLNVKRVCLRIKRKT